MAAKVISTTHELTAKLWAEGLEAEVLKKISVSGFTGKGSDSVIQHRDMLDSNPGDVERVGLRMQDNTEPITSGAAVEGSELNLTLRYMDITLNESAHAFLWDNVMSRVRVTFEHRDEAKAALSDLLANAWDQSFFSQVCGITAGGVDGGTLDGNNPINAPEASKHIFVGQATEAAITATDILTLDDISQAKQIAKTSTPAIRKARIPGFSVPLFVVFIHPWVSFLMRQQDSRWDNICNSAMQGGMIKDNPLITSAQGIWDECLIVENTRCPFGVSGVTTETRRSVLCGAQSAMCVYGRIGGSPDRFRWFEKLFDYDRQMGVMGGMVCGIKKSIFSEEDAGVGADIDFATVVISSATHATDV